MTPILIRHVEGVIGLIEAHLLSLVEGTQDEKDLLAEFELLLEEDLVRSEERFESLPDLELFHRYGLELSELAILWLAMAPCLEPMLRHRLIEVNQRADRPLVDLHLVLRLLARNPIERSSLMALCSSEGALFKKGLLRFGQGPDPLMRELIPSELLFSTFRGFRALSPHLSRHADWVSPSICFEDYMPTPQLEEALFPILASFWTLPSLSRDPLTQLHGLAFNEGIGVILEGPSGAGYAIDLKSICGEIGHDIILVSGPMLRTLPLEQARHLLEELLLDAEIHEEVVYFEDASKLLSPDSLLPDVLSREMARRRVPVILSIQQKTDVHPAMERVVMMRISLDAEKDPKRQHEVWETFARSMPGPGRPLAAISPVNLAKKLHLNVLQVRKAVQLSYYLSPNLTLEQHPELSALMELDLEAGVELALEEGVEAHFEGLMEQSAREQVPKNLGPLAYIYEPKLSLDDVILDDSTLAEVRELVSAAKMRSKVLNEWGLGKRITRGTGIVVLLDGEPGTGKTQTAEVVAAELGLNVARVDVASLVDKYIGETEKNLTRIFTKVRPDVSMLFFDEADSLFAKRSQEGKGGANERYSNMNINLLLGLVERYGGVTILTTNLKKAIDPAFERRFTYKIRFSMPEKPERERIWRYLLPEDVVTAEEIDYEWLSEMEISGGEIKNAILLASFRAAHQEELLTNEIIVDACRREAAASGRVVRDFGNVDPWE